MAWLTAKMRELTAEAVDDGGADAEEVRDLADAEQGGSRISGETMP